MSRNAPLAGPFLPDFFSAPTPLTPEEAHALHQYQGVDYSVINLLLRNPHAFHAAFSFRRHYQVASLINRIDTALTKHRLKEAMVVYRGLGTPLPAGEIRRAVGTIMHDPAFVSTTLDLHQALAFSENGGVLFRIALPVGTPAMCMDSIEDLDEKELLLPRNGRFRILSAREQNVRASEHGTNLETIHHRLVVSLCLLPEHHD